MDPDAETSPGCHVSRNSKIARGKDKERQILGVRFFTGSASQAVQRGLCGGLVVVPAAPALIELEHDRAYREALLGADLVLTDSGLMVLTWRILQGERLPRVSGLEYLRLLLESLTHGSVGAFWILPTEESGLRTLAWLRTNGVPCSHDDSYVAPRYSTGEVEDPALLAILRERRPQHIVIGLGGGTQERLGLFLKRHLDYQPGIHCTGAAIAFITGEQVRIPKWADRLFLGWLFRCVSDPISFVPRYWRAWKLVGLMRRYRDRLPELAT